MAALHYQTHVLALFHSQGCVFTVIVHCYVPTVCTVLSLRAVFFLPDDGSCDTRRQNRHFIFMKMSHFITLIALLLCRRSPYTLKLAVWVDWVCIPGLSGKMSQETEREMERRKQRRGWHWSSFYTDTYCMTHSFALGRVRVWVSACPEVCGLVFCI